MNEVDYGPIRPEDGFPAWVAWRGEPYDTPDLAEIHGWVYDSACESLDGYTVEPDGFSPDGGPSWLIALGLI